MQLTNWNQEFSKTDLDKGSASMWIKIVSVPLFVVFPLPSPCNPAARALFFSAREAGANGSLAVLCCCDTRGLGQVDSWILALAYGWSMIAPKVLTGRSFDY